MSSNKDIQTAPKDFQHSVHDREPPQQVRRRKRAGPEYHFQLLITFLWNFRIRTITLSLSTQEDVWNVFLDQRVALHLGIRSFIVNSG